MKMSPQNTNMAAAVKLFFSNYVNFKGRSTRSEYWFAYLFVFIVGLGVSLIGTVLTTALGEEGAVITKVLSGLESLVFLIPNLSSMVRRLHDIGKSGWWAVGHIIIAIAAVAFLLFSASIGSIEAALGFMCFFMLALLAYAILMIVFMCLPSVGPNKWGYPAKPQMFR